MTHDTDAVLGIVAIFHRGDIVVKIMATTNGHRAHTLKQMLELVRPETLEEIYELSEQCKFGDKGTLFVINSECTIFRSSITNEHATLPHACLGSTLHLEYLKHADNPGYHPEAKPDDEVVMMTMSFWSTYSAPER